MAPGISLRQHLRAMMAAESADYRALLDDLAARLRETALGGVLKPADAMPEFVLPDAAGSLLFSGDFVARGPLAVAFVRGGWCPYCETTLAALDRVMPEIAAVGGSLVALTPDTGEYAATPVTFPVLSDVDSATALQFGTVYRVPDPLRRSFQEDGLDLTVRHGNASWLLPMPAVFVTDRAGIIQYAHASGDITDRAEPEDIVAQMRALANEGP